MIRRPSYHWYPGRWHTANVIRVLSFIEQARLREEIDERVLRGDETVFVEFKRFIRKPQWPSQQRPHIPQSVRRAVFARDGGKCRRCGSVERPELDHIHPRSRGGPDDETNLQLLCKPCNRRKGGRCDDKTVDTCGRGRTR